MPNIPPTHNPRIVAPVHNPYKPDDNRTRGWKLMKIRERIFKKQPLCVICLAMNPQQISKSVIVDHIIPLHLGGSDTDDNRQALCEACHNKKTASEATNRAANPSYKNNKNLKPKDYIIA